MRLKRIFAIAEKEAFHILRDPFTLGIALLLPVMMVAIFGLCIEFNVKNIPIAVYDGDHSQSSRQFIESMGSSNYFIVEPAYGQAEAIKKLDSNKDRAALIIEPQFEYNLLSGRGARAQVLVDGSDSSVVGAITSYLNFMANIATKKITGEAPKDLVELKSRYLYNPELNSRWFTVPGLLVMVLSMLSILLTALTVAREWENGSMELLLSTPVQPSEIIIGKLTPYVIMGMGAVAIVYCVARLFFEVPFRGSHFVFIVGCSLFLASNLALGLWISVITRKQQLAMQLSMQVGLLPSMLLSGFIFPIESMPKVFQYITAIIPARWFMEISRSVFLEGSGFADLKTPFLALTAGTALLIVLAAKNFKTDVEP